MKTRLGLLVVLIGACLAGAETTAPATQPSTKLPDVEMTVHPAFVPEPALKYELVPQYEQQTPGDGAQLYLNGFALMHMEPADRQLLDGLLEAPDTRFPVKEANGLLEKMKPAFDEIDLAAHREHCQWDVPLRELGFATPLPYLSHCRDAARLLSLRARVQLSQGHIDDALHTLSIGFAMAQHLNSNALLVQGLVGMSITNLMLDRLMQVEQAAKSPNLYWALTNFPEPVTNLRSMAAMERLSPWLAMPELKGRNAAQLSDKEWEQIIGRIHEIDALMSGKTEAGKDVTMAVDVILASGIARAWLISHGYNEQEVARMQPIRAVGIYYFDSYTEASDNIYKWMPLPYWQRRQGLRGVDSKLRRTHADVALNPLMELIPAISRVSFQVAKVERRVAMLRTVEAIRAYAAGHDGKLPAAIADLTETPVPQDPITGRPFDYEVTGPVATLKSDGGKEHPEETQAYHIRDER